MGSEKVPENFSWGSWKSPGFFFVSKRVGTLRPTCGWNFVRVKVLIFAALNEWVLGFIWLQNLALIVERLAAAQPMKAFIL